MGTGSEPSSIWCPKPKFHLWYHLNYLISDWNPCVCNLKVLGDGDWTAVLSSHPSCPLPYTSLLRSWTLSSPTRPPHGHNSPCLYSGSQPQDHEVQGPRKEGSNSHSAVLSYSRPRHAALLTFLKHPFHKHLLIIPVWTMISLKATEMCVVQWELPTRKANIQYRNRHANQTFTNK